MGKLETLTEKGLRPALQAALERYKRTGELGKCRPDLTPEDWEAVRRLTGRKAGPTLDLTELDAALRGSVHGVGLLDVLTELHGGSIPVRRQQREAAALAWADLLATVQDADWHAALLENDRAAKLLQKALKDGADAPGAVQTVQQALAIARAESLSFPVLAARVSGNAHALDRGTLAGEVFRAAAESLGIPPPERDGVSSSVLCANLRGPDWLNAAAGHVLALPLREVRGLTGLHTPGNRVWVVENPSVFEALHAACPTVPLICTSGQPGAAVTELLRHLPPDTTTFLSTDLDMGGLRIARFLRRNVALNWQLWRMDAQAYALACSRGTLPLSGPLAGLADLAPELVAAMEKSGVGAHQENLLPELLRDLADCPVFPTF